MEIREKIINEINKIEEEENIKIILAVESGSRAWGFESKDSDYDVRFIYVRPIEWYLRVFEGRDVLEYPINDELDICGWDLKKALQLFNKSNPPLLEWMKSGIVYKKCYTIIDKMEKIIDKTISKKPLIYHYLHMARGNFREYLQGDMVKIKKYFYVLRPVLACIWIEKYNEIPPVEFDKLKKVITDERLSEIVENLLVRKKRGDELNLEARIDYLNNFLNKKIDYYEKYAYGLDEIKRNSIELEGIFIEGLKEVWGNIIK